MINIKIKLIFIYYQIIHRVLFSYEDGMLGMRARAPPAKDFIDVFQKFKFSFNLLVCIGLHFISITDSCGRNIFSAQFKVTVGPAIERCNVIKWYLSLT